MTRLIAVLGSQGSGKTTTIEYLIKHLSEDGLKVGSIKHIHDLNFTFDTRGKDTWRHMMAGAKVVAGVSENEATMIKRTDNIGEGFEEAVNSLMGWKLDVIIFEGFRSLVGRRTDILKIVTAKNREDLVQAMKDLTPPILAVTGIIAEHKVDLHNLVIPMINLEKEGIKLIKVVKEKLMTESR